MYEPKNQGVLDPPRDPRNYRLPCLGECFGDWFAAEIPSDSEERTYLVVFNFRTGEAECDCWGFQRWGQERPCKHIRNLIMSTKQLAKAAAPNWAELASIEARYQALVEKRETIRLTLMPANALPAQVDAFLTLCSRYGLDPFTGEAWAFPKPGGGIGFMPGYRAYLRRAQEHPDFEFLRFGVVMKGEKCSVNTSTGVVSHEAMIDDDTNADPIGVWWQAKRRSGPLMAGRILLKNVSKGTGAWKDYPVQMLRKAALHEACLTVFGLRPPTPETATDEDVIDIPEGGYTEELREVPPVDEITGEVIESTGVEGSVGSAPEAPVEAEVITEDVRGAVAEAVATSIAGEPWPESGMSGRVGPAKHFQEGVAQ